MIVREQNTNCHFFSLKHAQVGETNLHTSRARGEMQSVQPEGYSHTAVSAQL